jgi:hypothetical protein
MGLPEGGHGSSSKTCLISTDDTNKVVGIKSEEDSDESDSYSETCLASSIDAPEFVNVKVEEETDEHGSYSESYLTSSDDAHEGVSVKADGSVSVKAEEDTDDSCSEACLTSDNTHEIVSIKAEADTDIEEGAVPEFIAFPIIRTEPEVRLGHCFV